MNLKSNNFRIDPMDKNSLVEILNSASLDSEKYNTFFKPKSNLIEIFENAKLDSFYTIYFKDNLSGYFSLRGLDDGYKIPRFGVYILEKYKSNKIGSYALSEAISLSKNAGFDALDLKVNNKNINAIKLYKSFGFKKVKKQNIEDIYILKF